MKAVFSGLIALILLGIYVDLLVVASRVVDCLNTSGCTNYPATYFTDGMAQALSVIGGLVSALVIAVLAVTKPGGVPLARWLPTKQAPSDTPNRFLQVLTTAYVLVWVVAGVFAFLFSLHHAKGLPALTNVGQAWLGLAVAAAYAYFELRPE